MHHVLDGSVSNRSEARAIEDAARASKAADKILSVTTSVSDSRSEMFRVTSNGFEGEHYRQAAKAVADNQSLCKAYLIEFGCTAAARAPQKKHRISAEGRARIAAAQRRRWAAAKKQSAN